ncbi:TPA: hypothetical protein ACH3X1_002642 [Trebouxia sp. C0004]
MGPHAGTSMTASVAVFKYVAAVLVQDAAGSLALEYPGHDVQRLLHGSPVFRQLMAEHQQKLAAKVFEPYRPQLLADQVRDLKVMVFEASLQQHTGKVPASLSRAQEFQLGANMDLQEEEQACHRAFEHIMEMADAGVPPPDHDEGQTAQELATVAARACAQAPGDVTSADTSTALAASARSSVSEPASLPTAATSVCMPLAALPLASASEVAATSAVPSAPLPQSMLPAALPGAGQGIRMQAGVTSAASQLAAHASRSPARQFRGPGMSPQPSVSMPVASGVDPAIAPFAGLLTSPAAAPPPPAVHGMMGGHGMIYVPGYGVMPVAPSVVPAWGPHVSAGMPVDGSQPAGMPVFGNQSAHNHGSSIAFGTMPVPGSMPQQHSAAAAAAGSAMPGQPGIVRAFPQLSSFKSLENLYEVVTSGDSM